ncbi:MAG: T9SS type A sorting domain-containing protein [Bacteroidia bacterium]|nr:T9SS type A sorting domain-containing protein [Bacteroidia bacterium]
MQRLKMVKLVGLVGIWMGMMVNFQPLLSQQISAGVGLSLFVCSDSTAMVWGFEREVPVKIEAPERIIAISGGGVHVLALCVDGTVWAGGLNGDGQLGLNDSVDRDTLAQVPGLSGIIAISAGGFHSMALRSDSTVWIWGGNDRGQLGDSTTADSSAPQQVMGLTGIVEIAAGGYFSMALQRDGRVWAWGSNSHGQVGDSIVADTIREVPVLLMGVDSIVKISAGGFHALALQSNGQAWAWGGNEKGQLGVGDNLDRFIPVLMNNGNSVTALVGGGRHTLALRSNGSVLAVGDNEYGQLGLGDTIDRDSLTALGGWMATSVAAGWLHSMIISPDGNCWAWGSNIVGQVGNGTLTDQWSPTQVLGLCPTYFAVSDTTYNNYFRPTTSLRNRWIAGELASSIALPDGRTIWLFGRSHLDSISPNNTIPCGRQEIDNCFMVQDSVNLSTFTTFLDTVVGHPSRSYFQYPALDSSYLLPGHGFVEYGDTATIFLSRYANDTTFVGNYAARIGIVTMTLLDITRCIPGNDEIDFGKAVIVDSLAGQLYLYGTKKDSSGRHPYLVRRELANDSATWYYATPTSWSPNIVDARPIAPIEVSDNFSVTAMQGHYYLITHNPKPDLVRCGLQRNILAYRSDSLKGPFEAVAVLATTPDSAANLPIFGFGAYTHQSLTHCDSLMLSYNVRDLDTDTLTNGCTSQCGSGSDQNADTWRPKFIHVPFPLLDTALSTTLTASFTSSHNGTLWSFHNTSLLADSYIWNFGDPASGTNNSSTLVNPTHNYTLPGNYQVTLAAFGCGTAAIWSSTMVHTSDPSEAFPTLQIYPNPSNGQIHVQATDLAKGPTTIEVFTLVGQKILDETHLTSGGKLNTQIDLNVPAGIYLLRFTNNSKTATRKLLIE